MESVFFTLQHGNAMADCPRMIDHMRDLGTPDLSEAHSAYDSCWMWAELIAECLLQKFRAVLALALYFSLSIDCSEAVGHIDYMSVVAFYCNEQFERVAVFVCLLEVGLGTGAAGQTQLVLDAITTKLNVSRW